MTFYISGTPSYIDDIDKFPGFVLMLSEGGHKFSRGYIYLVSGLIDNIYFKRLYSYNLDNNQSLEDKEDKESQIKQQLREADILEHSLQFILDDDRIWSLLINEITMILFYENIIDKYILSDALYSLKKDKKFMHLEELSDKIIIKSAPNGELEYTADHEYDNEDKINNTLSNVDSIEKLILTNMEYLKI